MTQRTRSAPKASTAMAADMAESILASGQADLVFIGRAMLGDPYWPMRAAKALRANFTWPLQYERGDIY